MSAWVVKENCFCEEQDIDWVLGKACSYHVIVTGKKNVSIKLEKSEIELKVERSIITASNVNLETVIRTQYTRKFHDENQNTGSYFYS